MVNVSLFDTFCLKDIIILKKLKEKKNPTLLVFKSVTKENSPRNNHSGGLAVAPRFI